MARILVLGSGFVAQPVVDELSSDGNDVTVACRTLNKAQELASRSGSEAISLDVNDSDQLDLVVGQHDLVISLIPYIYHPLVVKSAIRKRKHVVTTSYISDALRELHDDIKKAGIIVMNEIGLDPGIDHLYAVKIIDEVQKAGGEIKSFLSYCGGLPAPEDSDNPLGYKFSWSSRGVLLALKNSAKYWRDGQIERIESKDLMSCSEPYFIYPGFAFVCYPNRDSTLFRDLYGISEAETVIRGTLRYQGFPEFVKTLVDIGLLSDETHRLFSSVDSWCNVLSGFLGAKSSSKLDLIDAIDSRTNWNSDEDRERILLGLQWLGFFSDDKIIPRDTPLDTLCATLEQKMQYEHNERDMVVLQHKFHVRNADGTNDLRLATMIKYGDPESYSAMAATVGYPCAIAAKLILNGTISAENPSEGALLAPYSRKIVDPIIDILNNKYDIYLKEKTIRLD